MGVPAVSIDDQGVDEVGGLLETIVDALKLEGDVVEHISQRISDEIKFYEYDEEALFHLDDVLLPFVPSDERDYPEDVQGQLTDHLFDTDFLYGVDVYNEKGDLLDEAERGSSVYVDSDGANAIMRVLILEGHPYYGEDREFFLPEIELNYLRDKYGDNVTYIHHLEEQVVGLNEQIADLQKQVVDAPDELYVAQLEGQVAGFKEQIADLQKKTAEYESSSGTSDSDQVKALRSEVAQLKEELAAEQGEWPDGKIPLSAYVQTYARRNGLVVSEVRAAAAPFLYALKGVTYYGRNGKTIEPGIDMLLDHVYIKDDTKTDAVVMKVLKQST